MKDHWAIVRNYEGVMNCFKRKNDLDINHYLDIVDKMAMKYQLEEAEMNFINMMKDLAAYSSLTEGISKRRER